MQIDKRSRAELKQYFVKNAIPTESNFAEFIDAMMSQRDDGIIKLPNDALSIEAVGDDTSQKKAIQFYGSFGDANPAWVLSLNPRQDPANAATAKAGFSISDAAGNSRLFIDRATGSVGIGTTVPSGAKLQVTGTVKANRFTSDNALVLNDYTTPNPSSNVYLYSPQNDRDAWIYLDCADTTRNRGIYHRQIDSPVKGLPANSIGFIGGESTVFAYISLADGTAFFASKVNVDRYVPTAGGVNAPNMEIGGPDPVVDGSRGGVLYLHDHGRVAHQLRYNNGTLFLEGTGNGYGTTATPALSVGGWVTANGGVQANGQLRATGEAGVLDLEGIDHVYIQWYPMKAAAGRKGWIGYGSANTTSMSIWNDAGELQLRGSTVRVYGDLELENSPGLGWARGVADFIAPLRNGFYQALSPAGAPPDTSHPWWHLLSVRHSNSGNHHQLQIASSYSENDRLFFRKIARNLDDNNRPGWNEVATVTNGILKVGDWTIESAGNHLYIKRGASTVVRISIDWDRLLVFKDLNGKAPYFFFNQNGDYGVVK